MGVFPLLARFAHSCTPSAGFHWSALQHRMLVHALAPTPSSALPTIWLVDPFTPARARREALRARFGFRCRCPTCELPEDLLQLSDARRAQVAELWRDMPHHQDARRAVDAVESALALLAEEGLVGFRGCFCYDAFQYCVACSVRRSWVQASGRR